MPKYFSHKRETKIHKNSIPGREFIIKIFKQQKKPINFIELTKLMGLSDKNKIEALRYRILGMKRDGQLLLTDCQKNYILPKRNVNLIQGKVIGHRDGYGFLRVEGHKDDFYLSTEQMKYCMHGDFIIAQLINNDRKGRQEARVIKINKPRNKNIVGHYRQNKLGVGFVVPDDSRLNFNIIIPSNLNLMASENSIVVVKLLQRPKPNDKAIGKIIEIIGKNIGTNLAIDIAIRSHEIPYKWSAEAKLQINNFTQQITEDAKIDRIDLRKLPLITIDDEDARDFDDALYCEETYDGWRLWVAIADVSYYVRPGTPLDKEAFLRGTSVYFPSKVIPMLPEILSNELCSLNPQVDCLCMVCEMHISSEGKLIKFKHYEAIMNSHARLTYDEAYNILKEHNNLRDKYVLLKNIIQNLHKLYQVLEKARQHRGGISFETAEIKFIFNSENRIDQIKRVFRNDIHKVVEECMILANFATASFVEKSKEPTLFRDHDRPSDDSIKNFNVVLNELGIGLSKGKKLKPIDYSLLLMKIATRPDAEMLQIMLLRSMKQAIYAPQNRGHFGLALTSYTHFTSPIRRYPDLILHRILKYLLSQHKIKNLFVDTGGYHYTIKDITKLGYQCSLTERRADEAVRDVSDWLKCDFMKKRIGKIFDGIVFSVTNFGLFVRLNEFFIEGLIHISTLKKDYYKLDIISQRLIGQSSGNIYRLGDAVKVHILAVNMNDRRIDFTLISSPKIFNKKMQFQNKNIEHSSVLA
ncbi:ribonuclease R [Candidatus Pantoea edessiphila]|uniref:Ribonuclease R n=1 Tax=Candidatus Pantoea edessiphila TaxID=2044610 RepID=A0A2P5SXQ6_9GAMM|nr:ribonuclease R [Candidatus Pantoea edessiphila]MBK4775731.1 ribonuclease R [Pantoea sp. Edef]PPI87128.1 ribonuclease R [Candidatus Pantoea edessiphila]